jgi:hypothetical protein
MVAINFNLAVATQVLSSLNSQVCDTEWGALKTCVDYDVQDSACGNCIIDAHLTIFQTEYCEELEEYWCPVLFACETDACADCSVEFEAYGTCMVGLAACPGLCEGQDVFQIA